VAPVPEAKNELPFTRQMGVAATTGTPARRGGAAILAAGGGGSGGVDRALLPWGLAGALTIAAGTAVALSHARLSSTAR
jgi:hypothetical protein